MAYIYGYNLEDTCTTNDMEVAASLMRADPQGLQNITEYDDHVIRMLTRNLGSLQGSGPVDDLAWVPAADAGRVLALYLRVVF